MSPLLERNEQSAAAYTPAPLGTGFRQRAAEATGS
jgi:hypothetical protein